MPYTKLFNSIITSTLWLEPDHTRLVWITMLALADINGEVQASVPGLAKLAGVTVEGCQAALDCLSSPDPHSRTKTADGRRIVAIDGGWELINHAKYRKMASEEDKREANAKRQARHRARHAPITDSNAVSHDSNAEVTPTGHKQSTEAHSDSDSDSSLPSAIRVPRKKKMSDADFLAYLKGIEAFKHVNIDLEVGRAQAWIASHPPRQLTQKFLQNWIGRAAGDQRTMNLPPSVLAVQDGRHFGGPINVPVQRFSSDDN